MLLSKEGRVSTAGCLPNACCNHSLSRACPNLFELRSLFFAQSTTPRMAPFRASGKAMQIDDRQWKKAQGSRTYRHVISSSAQDSKAPSSCHNEVTAKDDASMWRMIIVVGDGGRVAIRKKSMSRLQQRATLRRCEHQLQRSHVPCSVASSPGMLTEKFPSQKRFENAAGYLPDVPSCQSCRGIQAFAFRIHRCHAHSCLFGGTRSRNQSRKVN